MFFPYLLDLLFQSPHLQRLFFVESRGFFIAKRRGNHLAMQTPWHQNPPVIIMEFTLPEANSKRRPLKIERLTPKGNEKVFQPSIFQVQNRC